MTKLEFILALHEKLSVLSAEDAEERVCFYSEMIDDRMEEGLSEEEAVAAIGTVDEIAQQIIADTPITKLVKQKMQKKRNPLTITLLAVGSVVWFPLLIAALAIVFSLYVSLWSIVVSLWAVFTSFAACALGGVLGGIILICTGKVYSGVVLIAGAFVCAGLAIFSFFGCKAITKGCVYLTAQFPRWVKRLFLKKEEA